MLTALRKCLPIPADSMAHVISLVCYDDGPSNNDGPRSIRCATRSCRSSRYFPSACSSFVARVVSHSCLARACLRARPYNVARCPARVRESYQYQFNRQPMSVDEPPPWSLYVLVLGPAPASVTDHAEETERARQAEARARTPIVPRTMVSSGAGVDTPTHSRRLRAPAIFGECGNRWYLGAHALSPDTFMGMWGRSYPFRVHLAGRVWQCAHDHHDGFASGPATRR